MANALSGIEALRKSSPGRDKLSAWTPRLIILPSAVASFVYVFVFTLWTLYLSLSNSAMLPTYQFVGLKPYFDLWSNRRWTIAYENLFLFSAFYVVLALVVGLALAIAIDQRVKGEALWRTIFLYPLAVSFVVTGSVWNWLYGPDAGIEYSGPQSGVARFHFPPDHRQRHRHLHDHRDRRLAVVRLRDGSVSRRPALGRSRSHQGGANRRRGPARIYRKVILPSIAPIFIAVAVVLLQFAIKTFDLVVALTARRTWNRNDVPGAIVYDLMFQRGQIAIGAAASMMMLAALAVVLVPYALWTVWRSRRATHG